MIILLAAVSKNGYIGKDGVMPWKCKEELQFFKSMTINKTVVMGRTTFESIGKPLKDRVNVVVSRSYKPLKEAVMDSLEHDLEPIFTSELKRSIYLFGHECCIIGGAQIYQQVLDESIPNRLYISKMNFDVDGDTKFPEIPNNYRLVEVFHIKEQFAVYRYDRVETTNLK